jgi:hypothetical protein
MPLILEEAARVSENLLPAVGRNYMVHGILRKLQLELVQQVWMEWPLKQTLNAGFPL